MSARFLKVIRKTIGQGHDREGGIRRAEGWKDRATRDEQIVQQTGTESGY